MMNLCVINQLLLAFTNVQFLTVDPEDPDLYMLKHKMNWIAILKGMNELMKTHEVQTKHLQKRW